MRLVSRAAAVVDHFDSIVLHLHSPLQLHKSKKFQIKEISFPFDEKLLKCDVSHDSVMDAIVHFVDPHLVFVFVE